MVFLKLVIRNLLNLCYSFIKIKALKWVKIVFEIYSKVKTKNTKAAIFKKVFIINYQKNQSTAIFRLSVGIEHFKGSK